MKRKESYPYIQFSAKTRRKISLFFTCFFFALAVWLFYTLSKEYTFNVVTKINYRNYPAEASFHVRDPGNVNVIIKGTGWQLLFSRFRFAPTPLELDLVNLQGSKFISLNKNIPNFNNQISVNQKIISIYPDTIFIDYATRLEKKVPIQINATFTFAPRHNIASALQIIPDSILISGPVDIVREITFWPTPELKYTNLRANQRNVVVLTNPNLQAVNLKPNVAQLVFSVEEFTEKSIKVPITTINNTDDFEVQLIPQHVEITFLVPLSRFVEVDESNFEILVDLSDWKKNKLKKLVPKLNKQPDFIQSVKIDPLQIDFLIKK